ncbi:MAG: transposase [Woeseia sp.]
MPRQPRLHVPGAIYHVMLRGNNCQDLFFCATDHIHLIQLVDRATSRLNAKIHAFCWMSNHIHLAIQISDEPLGRLIQWIASRYAYYINRRLGRTGHVFERRYRAILVYDDSYLLALVRYIHLNPVKAGMVTEPEAYHWSSHRYYLGRGVLDWLVTDWVLSMFDRNLHRARESFHNFVTAADADDIPAELLIGSDEDRRLAGGNKMLEKFGDCNDRPSPPCSLEDIIDSVCAKYDTEPASISGPSRQRRLVRIRAEIACEAVAKGAATLAEIGRRLHRSDVAIGKLVRRYADDRQVK